ncbi:unnamed protein product [Cylicocyclus nassatus]|uniref:Thymidylate synthase n=1 Tax=Cylicocyclus nassatus TaxID=53992 RepID=A0AA36DK22_CYLNA|nr:unnamed protein product [Cylicocyclus nassatus]
MKYKAREMPHPPIKTGDLVHTLGDAHIYVNHIEALQTQVKVEISAEGVFVMPVETKSDEIKSIDDFTCDKIILKNYQPQPAIKKELAA